MDVTGLVDVNEGGGINGTKACKIINKNLIGNNIPGFISLGNPWVYADTGKATQMSTWGDGGITGGIALTSRPDAISLEMNGNSQSCASVIAYIWKGEFVSQVRSAITNNGSIFKPNYVESATIPMSDVDRAILGRTEADQKGTLIASTDNFIDYAIGDEYKNLFFEFDYKTTDVPEKINVIISASNHWERSSINANNSINVDNVKLIYYSRLSALKVGGVDVEGFNPDVFSYTMSGSTLPTEADIEASLMGKGAKSTVTIDPQAATVTINVVNDGNDVDDVAAHSYVLQYDQAPTQVGEQQYPGYLNITVAGTPCPEQAATITITEYSDGTCTFLLPDLNVQLGDDILPVGDIKLENVHATTENGETTYTGYGKLTVLGAIEADVNISGTVKADGTASFDINVDASGMPVIVTFTTESQAVAEPVVTDYPGYLNINAFGSP
ncbi:MAG: calycin-like domain-containing protein, partial [Muribaculaceae bacterium]|nr:calycin-like domain-containing protein [Muribaculaceae bacterium]